MTMERYYNIMLVTRLYIASQLCCYIIIVYIAPVLLSVCSKAQAWVYSHLSELNSTKNYELCHTDCACTYNYTHGLTIIFVLSLNELLQNHFTRSSHHETPL